MRKFIAYFIFCIFVFSNQLCYAALNQISAFDNVSVTNILMSYKGMTRRPSTITKMKRQADKLSEEEKNIIKKYVFGAVKGEDTFLLINCYLRNNLEDYIPQKEITTPLKYRLEYYANNLSQPIVKSKLPKNTKLYFGTNDKGIKYIFKNKNIKNVINKPISESGMEYLDKTIMNSIYEEKGFINSTYDINQIIDSKYIFELNVPKNTQAVLMDIFGRKKEILINKNTKWEVVNISLEKNNKTSYYKISLKPVLK